VDEVVYALWAETEATKRLLVVIIVWDFVSY